LNLSGMHFSRGITYSFPNDAALVPDGYAVLASNKSAFLTRYGFQAFGEYEGRLDNNGETLALNSAEGDTLIRIHYTNQFPWPNSADGDGHSIVTRERYPYKDQNDAANWMASREIHGNPGRNNIPVSVQEPPHRTIPDEYQLLQNYPNPFNAVTKIDYALPVPGNVTLNIYNTLGKEIFNLVSEEMPAGRHSVKWDASGFAGGMYLCRIQAGNFIKTRKLVLMK
jgi:hypothetical protein